jgi:hypothetical protein
MQKNNIFFTCRLPNQASWAPESGHLGSRIKPLGSTNKLLRTPESGPCEPPNQAPANFQRNTDTDTNTQTHRKPNETTHPYTHTHTHTHEKLTHMHTCACWCTQMQTKSHENQQSTRTKKSHEKPPNPRILYKKTQFPNP